ncbi:hypothetical protein TrLO_g5049 [Triparma laevis f. longispina]|uniref:Nitrate reductase n=2 Tax=Triparma laevis TaxID=1534972 RepID=A0A9W6ZCR0_9STRA|nr:hypothetical protein TrLO_g5049 [Triparma laevis f. longispina]
MPPGTNSDQTQPYGPFPAAKPVPFDANGRPASVDAKDVGTPDEWVQRDGRMVRLTGRHPFNTEAPLKLLHDTGFITPPHLHYVRNHGAVPKLSWDDHTVKFNVLSTGVTTFTMDDILKFPSITLPVTLCCAGNRRKEQNLVRQTIGFGWGAAGVSTSVWTGVRLSTILDSIGIPADTRGLHCEMIGVEDLPNKVGEGPFAEKWGAKVKYGTSLPLAKVMNEANDIFLAYEQNGERLTPDHGYPIRVVIPGYIGGRMIKWLDKVNIIQHETHNHYHYHDNRILPPAVTYEESLKGKWWYKPEYIFNELNINSAIATPDHDETLNLVKHLDAPYTIKGYAYSGGGRAVSRVEVTLDDGVTWTLADIIRTEETTPHDMKWCWVFWKLQIHTSAFVGAKEIMVRATDEASNRQPRDCTWNLMGMGNNCYFRIKIHNSNGVLRFEHPDLAGTQPGGWLTRKGGKLKSAGYGLIADIEEAQDLAEQKSKPAVAKTAYDPNAKKFTMTQVAEHDTEDSVWIVVEGKVYDCTPYLEDHPGGADSIMINAGCDATEDFQAIHSIKATKLLEEYYIGDLITEDEQKGLKVDVQTEKIALNPKKKVALFLQEKIVLSHDSFLLNFALQTPDTTLGLPTGNHIFLSGKVNGKTVMRRYTPVSSDYDVGCVKFVIKAYPPAPPRFPDGGIFSQHLDSLKIGDTVDFKGPVGEFNYSGDGKFTVDHKPHSAKTFCMIAGGTGITPAAQVAAEILRNPEDPTKIHLIFGCRNEGDLLLRSTLDRWASEYPDRITVHYILSDSSPPGWSESGHSTGFVSEGLFREQFPPPSNDVWVLMCGPPIMLERGCLPALAKIGYATENIFSF